jgi:hypothetical protein
VLKVRLIQKGALTQPEKPAQKGPQKKHDQGNNQGDNKEGIDSSTRAERLLADGTNERFVINLATAMRTFDLLKLLRLGLIPIS